MNQKYFTSGLIFVISVIIVVIFVYPKYQSFKASAQLVSDKQSELDAESALVSEANKVQARYKKAEADLLKVSDLLPVLNQKSIADLFIEIESIASESGVLINVISFGEDSAKSDNKYKTINVKLTALSSYDAFKIFSLGIEKNQHLMDVMTVSITPESGGDKGEKPDSDQATTTESELVPSEERLFIYAVSINVYYQ